MKTRDELSINVERAKAIATLVITAIVNVLNVLGYAMDAEPFVNACTSVLSAASIAACWWKNQNITSAAVCGQQVIDNVKEDEKLGVE